MSQSQHQVVLEIAAKRHGFTGVSGPEMLKLLTALLAETNTRRRNLRESVEYRPAPGIDCHSNPEGTLIIAIHRETGGFVQLDGDRLSAGRLFLYSPPTSTITPETTTIQTF